MGDYAALYWWEELTPPGRPIMKLITRLRIKGDIPTEAEVEAAVYCLRLNKLDGHMYLRAEHFNNWTREAYPVEGMSTPPPELKIWRNLI